MQLQDITKLLLFLALQACISDGSHFRGGTVSWKHISSNGSAQQLEVNFRFGWRRNYFTPQCDDLMISDQSEGYAGGTWLISAVYLYPINASVSSSSPPASMKCTSYSIFENWAYGYNSFLIEVYTTDPFYISYRGNAWIGGLYGTSGGDWEVPALIDLGVRSDTGLVNNPPRTFSPPIVRLQQGCPSSIKITSVDDDGDNVTCRYAGSFNSVIPDECGSVCNIIYPHFSLDGNTCTLHYDGAVGTYLVPIALMLEDHPSSTITVTGSQTVTYTKSDSLSQIPLQFLVEINATSMCNAIPTYPPGSISENDTVTVSNGGGTVDETLYAYASESTAIILQFIAIGPLGVQTTPPVQNNLTGAYSSNLTWTPSPSQDGTHIICYYAVDSLGKNGEQECFTVVVASADSNPCDANNGGCNDICVHHGSVRTCECSVPCWNLLDNMRTCAPPLDISCGGLGMEISMPSCASNRTVAVGSSFSEFTKPSCQSTFDGTHHQLQFTRQECSVSVQSTPYQLLYSANLWIWYEDSDTSAIITRGEWKRIPVACSVPTGGTVNGSFVPQLPLDPDFFPNDVEIEGMGKYTFYFEFFTSASFMTAVAPVNLPLQVSVQDRMYFSLGAVGQYGLVLFTEECTATSTATDGISTLSYTFIENGCLLDSTLAQHVTASSMENRFSMQAFEFENKLLAERQNAQILIQCEVMLCDALNNSTRCFQGCQPSSSRRKRSNSEGRILSRIAREANDDDDDGGQVLRTKSESPLQTTKNGFFLRAERQNDPATTTDSALRGATSTNWLLLVMVQICFLLPHIFF